jgi:DNA (cytosine-5)-methyltransferase 1
MTYNLWCNQLRALGYKLQSRELRACDYGVPTIRKRLFVIARCDGEPIVWPEPTHDEAGNLFRLKPYRTAAECIDWTLPCPSIFLSPEEAKRLGVRRPLSEKTLRRIALGIKRFVLENPKPFIVRCAHGEQSVSGNRWGQGSHDIEQPLPTVTASKDFALVSPTLIQTGYGERQGQALRVPGLDKPLGTAVGTGKHALVTSTLAPCLLVNTSGNPPTGVDEPLKTATTGNHHYAVAAFLSKYNGQSVGSDPQEPAPTALGTAHDAIVATHLTKLYGTAVGSDIGEPLPTVTGGGQHIGEVRAFLLKYYSTAVGQPCGKPAHTITAKARLGLVMVQGQPYQIADIGLRMLTPRELARAQGFPDSYILTGTKSSQVSKIGNSVCPPLAAALVKANVKLRQVEQVVDGVA